MAMNAQYQEMQGYLIAELSGQWTEREARRVIDEIRAEAMKRDLTRVLLDIRSLARPDNEMTRYYSGAYMARIWCPPLRVAALARAELITGFAETVAKNRGVSISVFTEQEAALRWLLQGTDTTNGLNR